MTNMSVVNGPIRNEIGMNCGIGAMGPYNHANATIGRAYSLLSQNLQGGSVPDESYMGSLGNGLAYSLCFRRERGAQPVGAAPRAEGHEATRQRRQRVLWLALYAGGIWAARHVGGEDSALPLRHARISRRYW